MNNKDYQKGYRAGRKAGPDMTDGEFFDAAFLALIPVAMAAQGWEVNGEPITSTTQRMELARIAANSALQERRKYRPK